MKQNTIEINIPQTYQTEDINTLPQIKHVFINQPYYLSMDLLFVTLILTIGPLLASCKTTIHVAQIIWPITWVMLIVAYVVPFVGYLWKTWT